MCCWSWAIESVHSSSTPGVMKIPWFMWKSQARVESSSLTLVR